jgi:hypothetical protein
LGHLGLRLAGLFNLDRTPHQGFSYLSLCSSEKDEKLERKIIQLTLMPEAAEDSSQMERLDQWIKSSNLPFMQLKTFLMLLNITVSKAAFFLEL